MKVVTTRIDDELFSMLQDDIKKHGGSYQAVRAIIREHYEGKKKPEDVKDFDEIEKTGNVIEDSKSLAASEIPSSLIKKLVAEIDNQKKTKEQHEKGRRVP